MKNLTISTVGSTELDHAANVFSQAMEITEQSKVTAMKRFWRMLYDDNHARFTAASRDGEIVGSGGLIVYELSAWVAFMGVLPGMQRKHIGNHLLTGLLEQARSLNKKTLKLDASNLGHGLYARYGFEDEYRVHYYEITESAGSDSPTGSDIRVSDELPAWCLGLDRLAFGDDRSGLLGSVLKHGAKALVYPEQGYGLVHKDRVGPIIAESWDAASAILRHAYGMGARRVYVPLHDALPRDFLAGLKKIESTTSVACCDRMILGTPLTEDTTKVFASFSPATG